ncbi:unnamed protein product [Rangifer tarandus platyrhynchus]|uniref:Uncharacterized protein n=1 Tax=Rangifer tarandus platyrhynchus TaxID=3082113 RepID=A0ACB1KHM4_RANTA
MSPPHLTVERSSELGDTVQHLERSCAPPGPGYVEAGTLSPLTIPGSRALVADGYGTPPAPPVPRGDSRMLSEADMSWLPWKLSCAPVLMAGHERHSRRTR